jgi:hypothetical protein
VGLRFQRRVRLLPGVHLNLSRSGIGVSVGGRGTHVGITARGQRYASVGLPGTGASIREYEHKSAPRRCELCQEAGHVHVPVALVVAMLVLAAIVVLGTLGGK